jgi:hypothetical protein
VQYLNLNYIHVALDTAVGIEAFYNQPIVTAVLAVAVRMSLRSLPSGAATVSTESWGLQSVNDGAFDREPHFHHAQL